MSPPVILFLTALAAAAVNGGLGYGFSSITLPVALLFRSSRALNPALVLVELVINAASLLANRRSLRAVLPRVRPLLWGIAPGAAAGGLLLAHAQPGWLKLFTFAALLPFVLLQLAHVRRPVRDERRAALPAGLGLGFLYGATTISGPPLAVLFNNQGLSRDELRAALAIFRIVESAFTAALYAALGLFSADSSDVLRLLLPAALAGFPLGFFLLRLLPQGAFRRACLAADGLLIGFGLSRALVELGLISPAAAWGGLLGLLVLEGALLGLRFKKTPLMEHA